MTRAQLLKLFCPPASAPSAKQPKLPAPAVQTAVVKQTTPEPAVKAAAEETKTETAAITPDSLHLNSSNSTFPVGFVSELETLARTRIFLVSDVNKLLAKYELKPRITSDLIKYELIQELMNNADKANLYPQIRETDLYLGLVQVIMLLDHVPIPLKSADLLSNDIKIDCNQISIFNQHGGVCWFHGAANVFFLGDGFREITWKLLFKLQEFNGYHIPRQINRKNLGTSSLIYEIIRQSLEIMMEEVTGYRSRLPIHYIDKISRYQPHTKKIKRYASLMQCDYTLRDVVCKLHQDWCHSDGISGFDNNVIHRGFIGNIKGLLKYISRIRKYSDARTDELPYLSWIDGVCITFMAYRSDFGHVTSITKCNGDWCYFDDNAVGNKYINLGSSTSGELLELSDLLKLIPINKYGYPDGTMLDKNWSTIYCYTLNKHQLAPPITVGHEYVDKLRNYADELLPSEKIELYELIRGDGSDLPHNSRTMLFKPTPFTSADWKYLTG